ITSKRRAELLLHPAYCIACSLRPPTHLPDHLHHFHLHSVEPLDLFDDLQEGETIEDKLRRDAEAQKQLVQNTDIVMIPQLPAAESTDNAEETNTAVPVRPQGDNEGTSQ